MRSGWRCSATLLEAVVLAAQQSLCRAVTGPEPEARGRKWAHRLWLTALILGLGVLPALLVDLEISRVFRKFAKIREIFKNVSENHNIP